MLPRWVYVFILLCTAHGHSWLECTDYRAEVSSNVFVDEECYGYMREWTNVQWGADGFGVDRGMNYQPGSGSACRDDLTASSYDDEYPEAIYEEGATVKLLWPSKNHAAEECTNPYIPSTRTELYATCEYVNGMTVTEFLDVAELVIDWGSDGFQNCPYFCDNMDKAICEGSFIVPSMPCDRPTFLWYWAFNSESDLYTVCFETTLSDNYEPGPESPKTTSPEESSKSAPSEPEECVSCSAYRLYAQCAGRNYNGETCCPDETSCNYLNDYYSQCY